MSNSGVRRKVFIVMLGTLVACAGVFSWWFLGQSKTPADVARRRWEIRWLSRHKQQSRLASEGTHRLVFVGDSITQNWETDGQSVWRQYYESRQPLNLGISSDKTEHVLWRVRNIDFGQQQPELFVLLVGTNNSADDSAAEIATGVKVIIDALQQNAPDAQVLLLAIFPRGETLGDPRRAVNEATNEILASYGEGEGVTYLDINEAFTLAGGATNRELMPDALHLNEAGYAAWAAAMEPTLSRLLQEE